MVQRALKPASKVKRDFGRRVKACREALGLSVDELAAEMHVHPETVRTWERGSRAPGLHQLIRLGVKLDKSLDFLIAGEPGSAE